MRTITPRRVGALLVSVGLVALTASPAQAAPAGRWWYTDLDVAKANKVSTGAGVTVAVLDSGVQASLPDLAGRVVAGTAFYGSGDGRKAIAERGARYYGHGTAMAAYIAGTGRGAGMRGVAPGATILPVTVGPSEGASNDAIQRGLVYATDHGAKVINISVAGAGACTPQLQQAVDYAVRKDVIVVAGTGNTPGVAVESPANCIGTLGIGGMAESDRLRAWQGGTTGPELDFVAPAENISALLLDNSISQADADGTSIATALTSGTFALLRAKFPKESARQIVTRALYNVANELGGKVFAKRVNDQLGYGEILPAFALTEAPPANAVNPIYDAIEKHLGASNSSSPSTPAGTGSSPSPSRSSAAGSHDSGGGVSTGLVVVIAVVVLVFVVLAVVLVNRSGRRRTPLR